MMGLMLGQRTIEAPDVTAQIFWLLLGVITLVAAVIFALSTWVYNRRVEL